MVHFTRILCKAPSAPVFPVPFKEKLPLTLRNRVSSKGSRGGEKRKIYRWTNCDDGFSIKRHFLPLSSLKQYGRLIVWLKVWLMFAPHHWLMDWSIGWFASSLLRCGFNRHFYFAEETCVEQMTELFECFKKNEYDQTVCGNEIAAFKACTETSLVS